MRWLALIALASACAAETETLEGSELADAGPRNLIPDARPDAEPSNPDCGPPVAIDFPCDQDFRCVNEREYVRTRTVWCQEIYGNCPCSGATCMDLAGIETCPEGQRCNPSPAPYQDASACVDRADAGISDV